MTTLDFVRFDAATVTRDVLRTVSVPEPTKTYFPISHDSLVAAIEQACAERGIALSEPRYRLSRSGTQFVGSYTVQGTEHISPDFHLRLGFRNSTDKTMVAGLISGARVLACDNGCFSGEIALERKHTRWILRDLPILVGRAVDGFLSAAVNQRATFEHWKTVDVTEDRASLLAVDAAVHGAIPSNGILAVRREFLHTSHPEFLTEGRKTAWTLYNAFTDYLTHHRETVSPVKEQRDFLRVHRALAEAFPMPVAAPSEN
jgi:hypothetical protein